MQSLKDLPQTVSPEKPPLKFLSEQKTCQLFPLNMWRNGVYLLSTWLMYQSYLTYLTILQFQCNWLKAQHFQLKVLDIAVTLKYGQGHWKWNEKVKLSEEYHNAKFDTYTFMVSRWVPMLKFSTSPHTWLTNKKHVNYLPWIHTKVTQIILCMIFMMLVATKQHLNTAVTLKYNQAHWKWYEGKAHWVLPSCNFLHLLYIKSQSHKVFAMYR